MAWPLLILSQEFSVQTNDMRVIGQGDGSIIASAAAAVILQGGEVE